VVHLVLTVCLAAAPASCKEERPVFEGPLSMLACATQGQLLAVRWLAEHPAYTLNRWRCEANRPRETPI
jgi:hypothetical protein